MRHQYNVKINTEEVLRYMGVHSDSVLPPDTASQLSLQLNEAAGLIKEASEPKYTYKVFDIDHSDGRITLAGTSTIIQGNDAKKLLDGCSCCIVFAATVGRRCDELIRRKQITDMTSALILDSCASSAIESICDQLNDDLELEYSGRGLFLTERYSPGYGDMPLALQTELCALLQTEKLIGLSVTPALTLTPTKSVTALIGVTDSPRFRLAPSCEKCRLKDTCSFNAAGQTCGKR